MQRIMGTTDEGGRRETKYLRKRESPEKEQEGQSDTREAASKRRKSDGATNLQAYSTNDSTKESSMPATQRGDASATRAKPCGYVVLLYLQIQVSGKKQDEQLKCPHHEKTVTSTSTKKET